MTAINSNRAIRGPVTAVPVVAGKGVRLVADTENNRWVVEADETVLCNTISNSSCTLSEAYSNFERIKISFTHENPSTVTEDYAFAPLTAEFYCADIENIAGHKVILTWCGVDGINTGSNNLLFRIGVWQFTSSTTFTKLLCKQFYGSMTGSDNNNVYVTKIVGINRIQGGA